MGFSDELLVELRKWLRELRAQGKEVAPMQVEEYMERLMGAPQFLTRFQELLALDQTEFTEREKSEIVASFGQIFIHHAVACIMLEECIAHLEQAMSEATSGPKQSPGYITGISGMKRVAESLRDDLEKKWRMWRERFSPPPL